MKVWCASSDVLTSPSSSFMTKSTSLALLQGCDTEAGQQHDQHEYYLSVPLPVRIEYLKHLVARHAYSRLFGEKAGQPPRRREKITWDRLLKRAEAVKLWVVGACISGPFQKSVSVDKCNRYINSWEINGNLCAVDV